MTEEKKKPKEQKKPRPPRLPIGLVPPDLAIRLSLTRPLIDAVPRDIDSPPKLLPIRNLREEYEYLQHLGHGSFGDVSLARYRFNNEDLLRRSIDRIGTLMDPLDDARNNVKTGLVAIKTMMRRSDTIYSYLRLKELQFIISIPSHPSLVQVFDMVIDDYAFELHIVMECMNQNLYQFMRTRVYKFSSGSVKSILTQLLGAINHIHEHGYFHRDVKPENILIISAIDYYGSREAIPQHRANDNYVVKLADYGLARSIYTTGNYTAYVATRWYRAPEILLRREIHSQPVDIWSFGVIAIELANFTPMVTGDDELDQLNKTIAIIGSPIPPPYDHYHPNVYYPLGGYWKEAQYLAEKLKLKIPLTSGISIYELLPDPNYADINDLVRLCITWDPERRASSSMLCDLPYFKDTFLATHKRKKGYTKWESRNQLRHIQESSRILNGINANVCYSDIVAKQRLNNIRKQFTLPELNYIYQNIDDNNNNNNIENFDDEYNVNGYGYNQLSSETTIPESSDICRTQTQSYDNFLQENLTGNELEEINERNYIYDHINNGININEDKFTSNSSSDNNNNNEVDEKFCEDILDESLLPLNDQNFNDYSFTSTDIYPQVNITTN